MSDPFAVRIDFIEAHLKPMNASQQSVQAAVAFALRNFSTCGEILWDCILEQCEEGNINHRMNLFYFIDALCERCLSISNVTGAPANESYIDFLARDLGKIVRCIVPEGRRGLPNRWSTEQMLKNWRGKRIVDQDIVDAALEYVRNRQPTEDQTGPVGSAPPTASMSHTAILRRMDEDRERHKRLREKRWVQPTPVHMVSNSLASSLPDDVDDFEFEDAWETTSDWNEDDIEAVAEEDGTCFPMFQGP